MSIIEVKGTRSDASETKSGRRYEVDSDSKGSMSPYIIGLSLTMLLLYWRSAFDSWAEAATPEKPELPAEDLTTPNAEFVSAQKAASDFSSTYGEETQTFQAPEYAGFTISRKAPLQPSSMLMQDGELSSNLEGLQQFMPIEIRDMISRGTAVAFPVFNANDNGMAGFTANVGEGAVKRASTSEDDLFDPTDEDQDEEEQQPVNRRPVVNNAVHLRDQFFSIAAVIGLSDLLRGATDPDGDKLSITDVKASSGQLTLTQDGFGFEAAAPGQVTFTYTVTDGRLSVAQTAVINILESPIEATADGAQQGDAVSARTSSMVSEGVEEAGSDSLVGSDGDALVGTDGDDLIMGGAGDDMIFGGSGNDTIWGGAGSDSIYGEDGDDFVGLIADGQADHVDGGTGIDTLSYEASEGPVTFDIGKGTAKSDITTSSTTPSTVNIDTFADMEIYVGTQQGDTFIAAVNHESEQPVTSSLVGQAYSEQSNSISETSVGAPQETPVVTLSETPAVSASADAAVKPTLALEEVETFIGGAGQDTLSYRNAEESVTINVSAGTATGVEIGVDKFEDIEIIETGSGDDMIYGDASNDMVLGGSGVDLILGGAGEDTLSYEAAEETITVDVAAGTATGVEIGEDSFEEIETIETGSGDDVIVAAADVTATTEEIATVAEDQTFIGGAGEDTLSYETAEETITVDVAEGTATGAEIGEDSFAEFEIFVGGSGDDTFNATEMPLTYNLVSLEDTSYVDTGLAVDGALAMPDDALEPTLSNEQSDLLDRAVMTALADMSEPEGTSETASSSDPVSDQQFEPAPVDNTFIGGAGYDTLSYAGTQDDLIINISTGTACGTSIGNDQFAGVEAVNAGEGNDTIIIGAGTISLDGGGGDDMFVFLTDTDITRDSSSDTQIRNFEVGDVVRISQWDLFENAVNEIEDIFKDVYSNSGQGSFGDGDIPIRVRHELFEELWQTFVDADLDRDDIFEISIKLDGRHDLIITSNQLNNTPNPDNIA